MGFRVWGLAFRVFGFRVLELDCYWNSSVPSPLLTLPGSQDPILKENWGASLKIKIRRFRLRSTLEFVSSFYQRPASTSVVQHTSVHACMCQALCSTAPKTSYNLTCTLTNVAKERQKRQHSLPFKLLACPTLQP